LSSLRRHGSRNSVDTLLTVNHYLDWEQVSDPQISPNGLQIVYTRAGEQDRGPVDQRCDHDADGSKNRFLVKGSNARWSPDGTGSAYFATATRREHRSLCGGWTRKARRRKSRA